MDLRGGKHVTRYNKKYPGPLPKYLNSDEEWNQWVYECSTTKKFDKLLCKIYNDDTMTKLVKEEVLDLLLVDMEDAGHEQLKHYKEKVNRIQLFQTIFLNP